MLMKNNPAFTLILVLMAAAVFISWPLYFKNYAAPDTVSVHEFPMTVGEWTAEEIPISDNDYAILETRNAFARMYTNANGGQVMLYIIYSQRNRRVAHPPEICYSGGGSTITKKYPYGIAYGAAEPLIINKVTIDETHYQQIMYYWFKIGDSYTPSYWRQQILIALKTLTRRPSSSAMIRLTSIVQNDDEEETIKLMDSFARAVMPILPKYLP